MKKIKDPALFEKIRKFLTEDMPVLRKKSPNTVEAYRYTLNIYLVFLCEKHSKSLYNITVKDFSQKNILFFLDWLIEERGNKASTANLRLRHIKRFCRFLMDESWHRNLTRPFPMYTPIYLGTPALCTCIWQVCRWSLFPNGSAILSWRHL